MKAHHGQAQHIISVVSWRTAEIPGGTINKIQLLLVKQIISSTFIQNEIKVI